MAVTLNCDLGEGLESDKTVMPYLDLANIACGGHAGDFETMLETLQLAEKHNVIPGAHPGYPDKENFGREVLEMSPGEIIQFVTRQLNDFDLLAKKIGASPAFVKPHGALNNEMCRNDSVLKAVCRGIVTSSISDLPLLVPVTSRRKEIGEIVASFGLPVWWEVFADRAYNHDGSLRSRKLPGAVHAEAELIEKQTAALIETGILQTEEGQVCLAPFDSICIHGDNPASVESVAALRKILGKRQSIS